MQIKQPFCELRSGCTAFLSVALFCATAVAQSLPNGVASGDVDQHSAVLWARSDVLGTMTFAYGADESFAVVDAVMTAEVIDPMIPVKVEVTDLTSNAQYYFRVTDAEGNVEAGRFRTAAADGFNGLRFGVSGDWRGELRPYPSISNIPERDLDFFAALGDTIYADFPSVDFPGPQATTLEDFRVKHNEVYSQRFGVNTWADVRATVPLYVCIDDHEVANDFAGGAPAGSDARFDETGAFLNETELFSNGMQVFQEFNPLRDEFYGDTGDARTAFKRKLYRFRTFGRDAAVMVLDARSFRDEEISLGPGSTTAEFLEASFDPTRTMLGAVQLADLEADLLQCQERGITWKFVMVPEPIQYLGPVLAGDRFEGYAHERSVLLSFIDEQGIDNVVFVAADIHGTIVNNLVYSLSAGGPQLSTTAFEITTGSVAFEEPFGPTVVEFVPPLDFLFNILSPAGENALFTFFANTLLNAFDYPRVGLSRSPIDAQRLGGGYLSINTYGWTEFEIAPDTQCLTVTTYGIDWYSQAELLADPEEVIGREPKVVSRFSVQPRLDRTDPDAPPQCHTSRGLCGAFGVVTLGWFPITMLCWFEFRIYAAC